MVVLTSRSLFCAALIKRSYVVSGTVAVFFGNPTNLTGKIIATLGLQAYSLEEKDPLFPALTKASICGISRRRVKFSY